MKRQLITLRDVEGLAVGCIHVSVFRPFPASQLVEALRDVKSLAVIERMDNPMAESNPLTMEIKSAFADALMTGKIRSDSDGIFRFGGPGQP